MYESEKQVLNVLSGRDVDFCPVWFMRQAGRYLPEYRALREKADTFVSFCFTPELASEATLQPLRRFDLDAAILFADILLIPVALGLDVTFSEGEGPRIKPVEDKKEIERLVFSPQKLAPVYETIRLVKPQLKPHQAMIGFCGGLWTVACYLIEGKGKTDFTKARLVAEKFPDLLERLQEKLFVASSAYLSAQIEAGAEVIQIFESHAGQLSGKAFHDFVTMPTKRLVAAVKEKHPHIPIIGFPRGAGLEDYETYYRETGIQCCGLDQKIPLDFAKARLAPVGPLQGNLDPQLLLENGEVMEARTRGILDVLGERLIFNLGHGIIKETPPEHVERLIRVVRAHRKGGT